MVEFGKDEVVIRLNSTSPVEDWQDLMNDLLDLMYNEDASLRGERVHIPVIGLMKELMPSYDAALKMRSE